MKATKFTDAQKAFVIKQGGKDRRWQRYAARPQGSHWEPIRCWQQRRALASADPLTVDFNREKPGANSTFGGGVHRCVGSMLARTELRIFLEEWLKRIPEFSIKPGSTSKVAARSVAAICNLELVWPV